jgi:hypothetical protein
MEPVSRRSFLATSSAGALGVAGAAAIGPLASAASASADDHDEPSAHELAAARGPALLQVHDAAKGEVELLIEERSIVFTDKRLVARLLRAAK